MNFISMTFNVIAQQTSQKINQNHSFGDEHLIRKAIDSVTISTEWKCEKRERKRSTARAI